MLPWYVFALLSAFFLGLVNVINKKILFKEHVIEFLSTRAPIMIAVSLFLIPFVDFTLSFQNILLIYFVSIIGSFGVIYLNKSLRHGEISELTPLTNLSPLFVLILATIFLKEEVSTIHLTGIFLLILGAYLLEIVGHKKDFLTPFKRFLTEKSIHLMLIALFALSIVNILDKAIIGVKVDLISYIFYFLIFISINYIIIDVIKYGGQEIIKNFKKYFYYHTVSSILYILMQACYLTAVSIPGANISLITPIRRTSSIFSIFIGGKMFHESNLVPRTLSTLVMIAGAILILL